MRNSEGAQFEGFGEWTDISEALMRGLSHGLTNRISSLGSFVTLHAMGDTDFTVDAFLPKESQQLQQLARALRLLVIDGQVAAIEMTPIVNDAIMLYCHHSRMNSMRCEVETDGGALMPIRAVRSAVLRLLVIMLDMGAAEMQGSGGDVMIVRLSGTDDELTLRVPCQRTPTPYAMALAEEAGATLLTSDNAVDLRIPTLLALKNR